jgi:hypothetical protein
LFEIGDWKVIGYFFDGNEIVDVEPVTEPFFVVDHFGGTDVRNFPHAFFEQGRLLQGGIIDAVVFDKLLQQLCILVEAVCDGRFDFDEESLYRFETVSYQLKTNEKKTYSQYAQTNCLHQETVAFGQNLNLAPA